MAGGESRIGDQWGAQQDVIHKIYNQRIIGWDSMGQPVWGSKGLFQQSAQPATPAVPATPGFSLTTPSAALQAGIPEGPAQSVGTFGPNISAILAGLLGQGRYGGGFFGGPQQQPSQQTSGLPYSPYGVQLGGVPGQGPVGIGAGSFGGGMSNAMAGILAARSAAPAPVLR